MLPITDIAGLLIKAELLVVEIPHDGEKKKSIHMKYITLGLCLQNGFLLDFY